MSCRSATPLVSSTGVGRNVDMGDPRCPEVRTIRGTQTSNWLESDDAPVVQVSQVPKVQIGDDTIGVSSGAVGAERVASGDPS